MTKKFNVINTIKSAIHLSEISKRQLRVKFKYPRDVIFANGNSNQYLRLILTLLDDMSKYVSNKSLRISLREIDKKNNIDLRLALYLPILIKEERFPFKIDTLHSNAEELDNDLNRDLLLIRSIVEGLGGKFLVQYKRTTGLCFVLFDLVNSVESQGIKHSLIYTYPEATTRPSPTPTKQTPVAYTPDIEIPISTAAPATLFNNANSQQLDSAPVNNTLNINQQLEKEKNLQDAFIESQRIINEQNILAQIIENKTNDQKAFQAQRDNEQRAIKLRKVNLAK